MRHEKLTFLGRKHTKETKEKMRLAITGKRRSQETRKLLSEIKLKAGAWSGENNPNWKGGVHTKNWLSRSSADYVRWKRQVIKNNGRVCGICKRKLVGVCTCCGQKIRVYVHHIKSFRDYPELRFEVSNGTVLCETCHESVENLANSVKPRTGNAELSGNDPSGILPKCVETIHETVSNN